MKDYSDSRHLYDFEAPCEGCGAKWHIEDGREVMDHIQPCPYLESLEYGGTKELGKDR